MSDDRSTNVRYPALLTVGLDMLPPGCEIEVQTNTQLSDIRCRAVIENRPLEWSEWQVINKERVHFRWQELLSGAISEHDERGEVHIRDVIGIGILLIIAGVIIYSLLAA